MTVSTEQNTVSWKFMNQWFNNPDYATEFAEHEIKNRNRQELIHSEMVSRITAISSNYYNHSSQAIAKILAWRQVRMEYFNEHIADSVGFRVLWDQWIDDMYTELSNCGKDIREPEKEYLVLRKRFYMEVPLPIEITDNKQFTLALLGQS